MAPAPTARPKLARPGLTAALCVVFVAGMVGMSFAAVPLYRLFCALTGYGGTTQKVDRAPDRSLQRTVRVRFDANIANGLDWSFRPLQRQLTVRVGEMAEAVFLAENRSRRATVGRASFNVTPGEVGAYFSKIACFCFNEQTLGPGESARFTVSFFVDPAIADNRELASLDTITLSYTFFSAAGGSAALAAASPPAQEKPL